MPISKRQCPERRSMLNNSSLDQGRQEIADEFRSFQSCRSLFSCTLSLVLAHLSLVALDSLLALSSTIATD
jgi:hypothetical protein